MWVCFGEYKRVFMFTCVHTRDVGVLWPVKACISVFLRAHNVYLRAHMRVRR